MLAFSYAPQPGTVAAAVLSLALALGGSAVHAQAPDAAHAGHAPKVAADASAHLHQDGRESGLELPDHAWVTAPPRWSPEAYFTNLEDGAARQSPFVARFGLSMRGIVPAGQTAGHAGHHHLLIDQPLPLDFKKPLPFTPQYVHFGKGQMEALIDLPPGTYTLRLVLADQGHIPYFVYSKPLRVTVTGQNKDASAATVLGPPRLEILGPADRSTVQLPMRMQLHASGYNISHAAPKLAGTGHFRVTLERPNQKPEVVDLTGGQTEFWLNPPRGDYSARVELVDNVSGKPTARGLKPVQFTVP
ncbi:DUF4399 domain-containing protein [Variovorax dokdonensis]|uniref:DUF4399 domain-containing protein n=1 Tax=Variovorax dokdonensis TaxID=344883 RepID=A0ABT7N4X9_9BURK|nr:DUF4399 domain-containing protein [Variovorax dokdonensis]MDM0043001.1 DUF4399 domain-containing protein [Variovorax dokdonensis]